ncbi:MAG: DUF4876 domain-containing protein [Sandaracinaceae bacterium]|nr:DUF4876 domain-containing protein [Sandaracinaceae bacterium]
MALAGLCLGDAAGLAGAINPGNTPSGLATEDPDHVYLGNVWCLPPEAQGEVLRPGDTLVLAHDGTNHAPYSALDLSDADFEAYNERDDGADLDYPTVPNLTRFHFTGGYDWLVTVFGPSMVLFVTADLEALEKVRVDGLGAVKVPIGEVGGRRRHAHGRRERRVQAPASGRRWGLRLCLRHLHRREPQPRAWGRRAPAGHE